jgi:hypothetical protein
VIATVDLAPVVSVMVSVHVPAAAEVTLSEPVVGPLVVAIPLQPLTVSAPVYPESVTVVV